MLNLPPGFDFTTLITDYLALVTPFVGIVAILVAGRLIRKTSGSI